jgi:regulator of sigma E protease
MSSLSSIVQLVVVISALIIIHELGHFLAARLFKVEVEEFGLGYPPRAVTLFEAGGTKYTLNWLPLGGFVRIKGENDLTAVDGLLSYEPWKRLVVYAAGPAMNLLAGIILYAIMFSQIGVPDTTRVQVIAIAENSPAEEAGLATGDIIEQINDKTVDGMLVLHDEIYDHLGEPITLVYRHDDQLQKASLTPRSDPPEGEGAIGIVMGNPTLPISWIAALPMGGVATFEHTMALVTLPAQIIRGAVEPEEARLVGYKGMYDIYQEVRQSEPLPGTPASFNILIFFTNITISLGILNLLPIPALDGGRILFTLPEIVLRRRIPVEWQNIINLISFAALILIFLYINLLDFTNPVQLP